MTTSDQDVKATLVQRVWIGWNNHYRVSQHQSLIANQINDSGVYRSYPQAIVLGEEIVCLSLSKEPRKSMHHWVTDWNATRLWGGRRGEVLSSVNRPIIWNYIHIQAIPLIKKFNSFQYSEYRYYKFYNVQRIFIRIKLLPTSSQVFFSAIIIGLRRRQFRKRLKLYLFMNNLKMVR